MSSQYLRETMDKISQSTLSEDITGARSVRYVVYIPETFEEPGIDIGDNIRDQGAEVFEAGTFWAGQRGPTAWVDDIGFARLFERESAAKSRATEFNNYLKERAARRGDEQPSGYAVVRPVEISLM